MSPWHGRRQTMSLNNICWQLVPPGVQTPKIIEILIQMIMHSHLLRRYALSRTPRKTVLVTTNSLYTNAPTARVVIQNAIVPCDLSHLVPIIQTPLQLVKNNSNLSTLQSLSRSHFLTPLPILQILHYANQGHYL